MAQTQNITLYKTPSEFRLPDYALKALDILERAGFEAWIVGGWVRDALLGRPSNDVDVATNAHWSDTLRIFEEQGYHVRSTGIAHGTITVIVDGNPVEITTFRDDGVYTDARHPEKVTFVHCIEEDLARRDFTINALAYHPHRGILDPYQGIHDIRTRTLKTVGNPDHRFEEDALRILRGCRFASQLGFSLDESTYQGMYVNKGLLTRISSERISHELDLLLLGGHAGDALINTVDILSVVLPELVSLKGFEQHTPYHIYDVLEHTAHVIDNVPAQQTVRWAALLHDIGKPATFFTKKDGIGHFYHHPEVSLALARGIMGRLSLPSSVANDVLKLVEYHDATVAPTSKSVKRMLMKLEGDVGLFRALCDLKRGDALSQAPHCAARVSDIDVLEGILDDIITNNEAFSLKHLTIKGNDVIDLGVTPGRCVGNILNAALNEVVCGRVSNNLESLQEFVRSWIKGPDTRS